MYICMYIRSTAVVSLLYLPWFQVPPPTLERAGAAVQPQLEADSWPRLQLSQGASFAKSGRFDHFTVDLQCGPIAIAATRRD